MTRPPVTKKEIALWSWGFLFLLISSGLFVLCAMAKEPIAGAIVFVASFAGLAKLHDKLT